MLPMPGCKSAKKKNTQLTKCRPDGCPSQARELLNSSSNFVLIGLGLLSLRHTIACYFCFLISHFFTLAKTQLYDLKQVILIFCKPLRLRIFARDNLPLSRCPLVLSAATLSLFNKIPYIRLI